MLDNGDLVGILIKSLRTANVLCRNFELLDIPSKSCTITDLSSLNLTVLRGLVKISAKLNFVGMYLRRILFFLARTSPQNLIFMSMCLVRAACVGLFFKICSAGWLSP